MAVKGKRFGLSRPSFRDEEDHRSWPKWALFVCITLLAQCFLAMICIFIVHGVDGSNALYNSTDTKAVFEEPDSLFAAITLLLGIFIPVAIDKHRARMTAYMTVAQKRDTAARYVDDDVAKKQFIADCQNIASKVRVSERDADFRNDINSLGKDVLDTAEEDYKQGAINDLRQSFYDLQSVRLFAIDSIYPDVVYFVVVIYFGVLLPFYNAGTMGWWTFLPVCILGVFIDLLYVLTVRDLSSLGKGSVDYKYLQTRFALFASQDTIGTSVHIRTAGAYTIPASALKLHRF